MNVSGNTFLNTVSFEDRNSSGAFQVPNYKVYDRNYSWYWDIGVNFAPPNELIIYDIDAQNIYQTVSLTASYLTYFRKSDVYFDEDLTFVTTLRRIDDGNAIHYVKVELDPNNNFEATITDLGNATASSSNGTTVIYGYDKKEEDLYICTIGSSGNFTNGGRGTRFMIYNTISETTTFYSQDWRGASFSIVGGGGVFRFRGYDIDFRGDQELFFAGRDQEAGTTPSLARYSYKTDTMTYSTDYIQETAPYGNILNNSLYYSKREEAVMISYARWNNPNDIINLRKYSKTDFSILDEIESFTNPHFSYVILINYDESRNTLETIGDISFGSRRYIYELGFEQENNTIPIVSGENKYTSEYTNTVSRSNSSDVIEHMIDPEREVIYLSISSNNENAPILIERYDFDFNYLDSWSESNYLLGMERRTQPNLNYDNTKILIGGKDSNIDGTGNGGIFRTGYIDIDFDDFSNSIITLSDQRESPIPNIQTQFETIDHNSDYYFFTKSSIDVAALDIEFHRMDFPSLTNSVSYDTNIRGKVIGSEVDRKNNTIKSVVVTNGNNIEFFQYDFDAMTFSRSATGVSISYITGADNTDSQIFVTDIRDDSFDIAYLQDGDTNFKVETFDYDMNSYSNPIEFDITNTVGIDRISVEPYNNSSKDLLFVRNTTWDKLELTQSDNTRPFIQNYTASIFRNYSASNVQTVGSDNRILKIYDSARGINLIQPSPRIAGTLIESDPNFNGEPSMDMDGEQNKLDFGLSYRTAVYKGSFDNRNQDKSWYLFIARCPYSNKLSRFFDLNDGSAYLTVDRANTRVIFVSGSHNVIWTSSVLSHDFGDTTIYAIKQVEGEMGKLWINGGTVIENDSGTDGTSSVFKSANRHPHQTFFGGTDRAVVISDFIALDTSDLNTTEEYNLVNGLMNPLATKYGLTWSNIT